MALVVELVAALVAAVAVAAVVAVAIAVAFRNFCATVLFHPNSTEESAQ